MTSCVVGTRKTRRMEVGTRVRVGADESRNVHTLARWCFSEDYGIPSGIIWLRLRLLLSLMWDALSQTVLHDGRHGSQKAKAVQT